MAIPSMDFFEAIFRGTSILGHLQMEVFFWGNPRRKWRTWPKNLAVDVPLPHLMTPAVGSLSKISHFRSFNTHDR